MNIHLGFGKQKLDLCVEDGNVLAVLQPNEVEITTTGIDEVLRALGQPIGSLPLHQIAKKGEKVVIITSDITRPMPSKIVLPAVLDELQKAGVAMQDITVVFALGSHRQHTEDEKKYLVGEEVYEKVRCVDSDIHDCVHMGTTSYGTPVDIFSIVAQADRRICLGNIEYHYFAGYSGGAKAIMPGVSTRAAISANHRRMVEEKAKAGSMHDNPVRLDIEEVLSVVSVDFIVNVVLDEKKTIIKAVAGDVVKAHRQGCNFLDQFYKIQIPALADIVVVSAGGFPKDINLYQAQKALDNAKHAVRKGGIVILLASCPDGLGEEVFEHWLSGAASPSDLVDKIQKNFELGGHKAAAIALVRQNADIFLVTDMPDELAKLTLMKPFANLSQAFDEALAQMGADAKIIIMPYGGSTLPVL